MLFAYKVLLWILTPLIIAYAKRHRNLRVGLMQRLGFCESLDELRRLRKANPDAKTLWLHGVSVGEAKLLQPIVQKLLAKTDNTLILITTTTPTGMQVIKPLADEKRVFVTYFPLMDLPIAVGRYVGAVHPKVFISAEAEAWPNLLYTLKVAGASTYLINARLFF